MVEQEKWKWQEPGTAWKGIGLYHITLTIPDRRPLLGCLEIPDNDPCKAKVRRTVLGNALVDCLLSIPRYHPEVQVLHFCLMPDHLHAVLYVRRTMATGIKGLVRGFWQAAKKLGRASSAASSIAPNDIRRNSQEETTQRSLHIQEETTQRAFISKKRRHNGAFSQRPHGWRLTRRGCVSRWATMHTTSYRRSSQRCHLFALWDATRNCPTPSVI